MRKSKLTSQEKDIEKDLLDGIYKPITKSEFYSISVFVLYPRS